MKILETFRNIRAFAFDVDGVMTDSSILIAEDGALLRTMNVRDGMAIKRALRAGYPICIITGGRSAGVEKRLRQLGIDDIYTGAFEKAEPLNTWMNHSNLDPRHVLYMGDDLIDLPAMKKVGLACCPADAVVDVVREAAYISPRRGGQGCVRDVIEKVLRLQDNWII